MGFRGSGFFREAGGDDSGFGFCPEGKIAFVTYADNFFVQAKSKQNLRGRGQQGNDTHIADFSTLGSGWEFSPEASRRPVSEVRDYQERGFSEGALWEAFGNWKSISTVVSTLTTFPFKTYGLNLH
jgi:hypothetical protein